MPTLKPAVQLYTLRDLVKQDFAGTLGRLAEIGYQGIELAGYGSAGSAAAARRAADDAGLAVCGAHVPLERLETDLAGALDEIATLGSATLTCPYLADARRADAAGYEQVADFFDRAGAACRDAGVTFCYHNHAFEFQEFPPKLADRDGGTRTGMDVLFGGTDPALVKSELDVFWVKHAGHDPAAYVQKMADRVRLLHLKDMADAESKKFAPVGEGILDFPAIVKAGVAAGVEWGIVEQDSCYDTPPLEAVRTSFNNLKRMGLV